MPWELVLTFMKDADYENMCVVYRLASCRWSYLQRACPNIIYRKARLAGFRNTFSIVGAAIHVSSPKEEVLNKTSHFSNLNAWNHMPHLEPQATPEWR